MSNSHLSRIETEWSMVEKAHRSKSATGSRLHAELIDRYGPAIKRYLLASMRSEDAAAEVYQEFALRLIRGDFKNADSEKGRFRNMIKTALYRLMIDYYRRGKRDRKLGSGFEVEDIADQRMDQPFEDHFFVAWRDSLLDEAWERLEQLEQQTGKPYHAVLRARVDHPNLTTGQLKEQLGSGGIDVPDGSAFRVFLHRSRKRFAAILLDKVVNSMSDPTQEEIEFELIELGLHHYCKPVM